MERFVLLSDSGDSFLFSTVFAIVNVVLKTEDTGNFA